MEQNKIATLIVVGPFGIKLLTISLIHVYGMMNMIITTITMTKTTTTTTTMTIMTTMMKATILGAIFLQMRLFSYFIQTRGDSIIFWISWAAAPYRSAAVHEVSIKDGP